MSWRWALAGVGSAAALSILALACARGQDGIDPGEGAGDTDPDGGGNVRLPTRDGGGSSDGGDIAKPDDSSAGPGCTGKVVLNELQCDGPGGAEFVELFNPNDCAVSLGGWTVLYRSREDNPGAALHSFGAGGSIAANDFVVLGNDSFKGAKQASLGSGMGNSGGQLGLLDDTGKLVDAVGYSSGTAGMYTEGGPAPSPGAGSVGRDSAGIDTDDNSVDFKAYAQPSPGAPNP